MIGAEQKIAEAAFGFGWKNRKEIVKKLKGLAAWWGNRDLRPTILVGAGGVGKTTLSKLISCEYDFLMNPPGDYEESTGIEKVKTQLSRKTKTSDHTKIKAELIVPPGQGHRRASTWTAYETAIAKGKVRGLILFGCYGYHSLGVSYKGVKAYHDGDSPKQFLPKFLKDQRQEEVAVLKRLVPAILSSTGKLWVLSLVTKQDLWMDNSDVTPKNFIKTATTARSFNQLSRKKTPKTSGTNSHMRHSLSETSTSQKRSTTKSRWI